MNKTPFLDCREGVEAWRDQLPHWHQPFRLQFVTWNLGDALPAKALKRLEREKKRWMDLHPRPWDEEDREEYNHRFADRVDRWLALGRGSAVFQTSPYADRMAEILLFHEGRKTRMDAFVVMPNHIHCLFQVLGEWNHSQILQSWKSYSSQQLNRMRGTSGKFWNGDYWDQMIRSPEHYWRVRSYIQQNPVKARLTAGRYRLWLRDPPLWLTLKEEGYGVRPTWGPVL